MTQAINKTPAPVAPRRPHAFTTHGIAVTDDYAWLKDANWQEVLRDPSVLDPDIRSLSRGAENDYTESLLGHTAALQKTLVAEMRGRIKEDDSSVPSPDGPFAYLRKFREGGQHEMFGRMPRDGGEVRSSSTATSSRPTTTYFRFGGARHSPDHNFRPGAPTSRARNILRSACATGDWRGSRRPGRGDRRRRGLERGLPRASSTSSSTTTTGRCRSGGIGSARRRPTTCWSTRSTTPAGSPISMKAPAAVSA